MELEEAPAERVDRPLRCSSGLGFEYEDVVDGMLVLISVVVICVALLFE